MPAASEPTPNVADATLFIHSSLPLTVRSRALEDPALPAVQLHEEPTCTTPCALRLPTGPKRLAVLRGMAPPLEVSPAFHLMTRASVEVEVVSHSASRRTGYWMMAIGIPLGIVSTSLGLIPTCGDDQECRRWASLPIWGGIGIASFSMLLGIPLATREDEARLRVVANGRGVALRGVY